MRIVFSTSNLPGSKLIEWATWSKFSHVDVWNPATSSLYGSKFRGGVRYRTFDPNYRYTWYEVAVSDAQEKSVWKFLNEQYGQPYDWTGVLAIPFRADWQAPGKWFCSELVAAAFSYARVPLVQSSAYRVTPRDLAMSPLLTLHKETRGG